MLVFLLLSESAAGLRLGLRNQKDAITEKDASLKSKAVDRLFLSKKALYVPCIAHCTLCIHSTKYFVVA